MALKYHKPVMMEEILDYLNLGPGKVIVDATAGTGGHSEAILKRILPDGKLIAIDRDEESLKVCRERLGEFKDSCEFVHSNFSNLDVVLKKLGVKKIDGILFDLGISSYQLDEADRGFSFQKEGPLDMRMDRAARISAYDLVNNLNEEEISALLWNFGQERWHNRIAHMLVQEREKHPVSTTRELADIVVRSIPYRFRHQRIHPATRTFQAVRIAVNAELENLESAVRQGVMSLKKEGRICVISFHSLEDRVIKFTFKKLSAEGNVDIVTVKPLVPRWSEARDNPRSRSSKLRVAERL